MARKKAVPVEDHELNLEAQNLSEGETVNGEGEPQEGLPGSPGEADDIPESSPKALGEGAEKPPPGIEDPTANDARGGEAIPGTPPDIPPESGEVQERPSVWEAPPEEAVPLETAIGPEEVNGTESVPRDIPISPTEAQEAPKAAPAEALPRSRTGRASMI